MSCTCQKCGKSYTVDISVPNDIWEKIKPKNSKPGGGLLCGKCIMEAIENISDYDHYNLIKNDLKSYINKVSEDIKDWPEWKKI